MFCLQSLNALKVIENSKKKKSAEEEETDQGLEADHVDDTQLELDQLLGLEIF